MDATDEWPAGAGGNVSAAAVYENIGERLAVKAERQAENNKMVTVHKAESKNIYGTTSTQLSRNPNTLTK